MSGENLQDLKQFITATISQQIANVATKDDIEDLRYEIAEVRSEMHGGFASVGEVISQILDRIDKHDDDHPGHNKRSGRRLLWWPRLF
ncbi:MAG TPA: hypothetical protein VNX65_02105 [Patescibacteria group bacterium]|jgi:hypothetical protein|nr:hypothetical protein [Patescibacteria group bacterium]